MNNQREDETELKKAWYRKRKITIAIGIASQCFNYFEYTCLRISALYYYKNSFNANNPNFYYGCVISVIFVSVVVSVRFCG